MDQSGERHFIRRRILLVVNQEEKWTSVPSKVIFRGQKTWKAYNFSGYKFPVSGRTYAADLVCPSSLECDNRRQQTITT